MYFQTFVVMCKISCHMIRYILKQETFVSQGGETSHLSIIIHHKLIRPSDDMIKPYVPKGNVTWPVYIYIHVTIYDIL